MNYGRWLVGRRGMSGIGVWLAEWSGRKGKDGEDLGNFTFYFE